MKLYPFFIEITERKKHLGHVGTLTVKKKSNQIKLAWKIFFSDIQQKTNENLD